MSSQPINVLFLCTPKSAGSILYEAKLDALVLQQTANDLTHA